MEDDDDDNDNDNDDIKGRNEEYYFVVVLGRHKRRLRVWK